MNEKIYYLYGEKKLCEQIAFVLKIDKYKIINNISDYNHEHKILICHNLKKIKKTLKQKKLKYKKDYYTMKQVYKLVDDESSKNGLLRYICKRNFVTFIKLVRPKITNKKIINKIPLQFLKPSEMLIKTLNSEQKNIKCNKLENHCNIDSNGYVWGCCPGWVTQPFGNILYKDDFYDSYVARIIKLSSLNKTYCFCNLDKCKFNHKKSIESSLKKLECKNYPEEITIAIDKSCNLKCASCRKCYYKLDKIKKQKLEKITQKIIDTGWLDKSIVIAAGQGEVFYSSYYKKIITTNVKRDTIKILSNGTLLNKKNWELLEKSYKNIYIEISIDAAHEETYKKLRCGNFKYLLKNLNMLGELRKENKIKLLQLNFVVQRDNYKEMIDFIDMANSFNVDKIQFTKLHNWGTFSKSEYKEKCMIIDNKYLDYELYELLKKPIFKKNNVDIETFEELMKNSKEYYGEMNE